MRTVLTKVYQFNELSDKAKERARSWWREHGFHYQWWDTTEEDFKEVAKFCGWDVSTIYFSGFSSQGDGACFGGKWRGGAVDVAGLKDYAPNDAELLRIAEALLKCNVESSEGETPYGSVVHRGHYSHYNCTEFDTQCIHADVEEGFIEASRDLMKWLYKRLEAEYDYLNSDEVVDETIAGNDYEFTDTGKRSIVI